jgi:hypothetical protein
MLAPGREIHAPLSPAMWPGSWSCSFELAVTRISSRSIPYSSLSRLIEYSKLRWSGLYDPTVVSRRR